MKTKELRLLIKEELAKELKENKRPDYPDVDKDGDREESMEKALKDKKAAEEKDVKEAYADLSDEERLKVGIEYDHETIAQAYLNKMGRDSNLKSDDLLKIGKKVVFLNYDGDLGAAYKDLVKEESLKEFKGETGEKRLDDLLDIILKYVEDPDNAEEELQNYIDSGYPGFSDMLKSNLDRDLDFQTWVQVGHDRGLEDIEENIGLNIGLADLKERGYKAGEKAAYTHATLVGKLKNRPDKLAYNAGFMQGVKDELGSSLNEDYKPSHRAYNVIDKASGEIIDNDLPKHMALKLANKKKGWVISPTNSLAEDIDLGHEDNEPHMLKADLYRIGKYSMELYKMVDKFDQDDVEVDFPSWWQSKIFKAKDALVGAKHYLDFELNEPEIDAMVNVASEEEIIDEEFVNITLNEAMKFAEDLAPIIASELVEKGIVKQVSDVETILLDILEKVGKENNYTI